MIESAPACSSSSRPPIPQVTPMHGMPFACAPMMSNDRSPTITASVVPSDSSARVIVCALLSPLVSSVGPATTAKCSRRPMRGEQRFGEAVRFGRGDRRAGRRARPPPPRCRAGRWCRSARSSCSARGRRRSARRPAGRRAGGRAAARNRPSTGARCRAAAPPACAAPGSSLLEREGHGIQERGARIHEHAVEIEEDCHPQHPLRRLAADSRRPRRPSWACPLPKNSSPLGRAGSRRSAGG